MASKEVLLSDDGTTEILMGNEAVARGALEAGVQLVASYPGTPSTEITIALSRVAKKLGIYVEWSINEMVAFEVAYGAALTGLRSMCGTKHLGLNWKLDPLVVSAYTGVNGSLVIAVADDTHPHSSQNAADTRYLAKYANVPCIEPTSPMDAKEITKRAFELSEKVSLPVIVRLTPRVAHGRGIVKMGKLPYPEAFREAKFEKDPRRYVVIASTARRRKPWLNERIDKVKEIFSEGWNETIENGGEFGVIASGVTYLYATEAVRNSKLKDIDLLKLITVNPLPEKPIVEFLRDHKKVLVLEENEPILEREIRSLAQMKGFNTRIYGRDSGHIPRAYELNGDIVNEALLNIMGITNPIVVHNPGNVNRRIPYLCAGCPHRASYYAIKRVLKKRGGGIVLGDRGCYNQGVHPPIRGIDTCICMGASIGLANGFSHAGIKEPIIAVIGDSTFMHAGIPPLINALYNKAKFLAVIFNNSITAMTGHEPSPLTGITALGEETRKIDLHRLLKGIGIEYVKILNPFYIKEAEEAIEEGLKYIEKESKPAVVVFEYPCAILERRERRAKGIKIEKPQIDWNKCVNCRICINQTGCPALEIDEETGKPYIIKEECNACDLCVKICPTKAIGYRGE
ncbi:indolepyruvate ferredoxin oxidoreductase subunit alpha [archaeon]|nr:MAG: indolepyruvate ferredoxin oxidoreductase subunit alpha [archaeon]